MSPAELASSKSTSKQLFVTLNLCETETNLHITPYITDESYNKRYSQD